MRSFFVPLYLIPCQDLNPEPGRIRVKSYRNTFECTRSLFLRTACVIRWWDETTLNIINLRNSIFHEFQRFIE